MLNIKGFINDGRKTLVFLLALVGLIFIIDRVSVLGVMSGRLSIEDSIIMSMFILVGYLTAGVFFIFGGVPLAVRLYNISKGKSYGGFEMKEDGLEFTSPLGGKTLNILFKDMKSVTGIEGRDGVQLIITKKLGVMSSVKDGEKVKIHLLKETYDELLVVLKNKDVLLKGKMLDLEVVTPIEVERAIVK